MRLERRLLRTVSRNDTRKSNTPQTWLAWLGGAALLAVVAQSWRAATLEQTAMQTEVARSMAIAEDILLAAPACRAAFDLASKGHSAQLRDGAIAIPDDVHWLHAAPSPLDEDAVVADRLARAAKAEFADHAPTAARGEYDALLAGPLLPCQRIVALAAAAWQSEREGDAERLASLAAQLDALIPELQRADLARPALSRSVAAALRLPRDREPEWAQRLAPFLPEADAAGLTGSFVAAHEATIARRRALLRIEAALNDARKTANAPSIARTKEGALWTLPLTTGTSLAAIVEPAAFVDAVARAGEAGALPRWPWLVQAELHDGDSPPFAGIPVVRGLAPTARDPFSESAQLWPFATAALALLFAAAWRAQRRAAMRERDAMTAQAEFLTNVTHELKTPLASIRLLGEMLAEGRAKGRESEYHAMLKAESARLSTLVESVLDLGRTERGERALSVRDFDLAEAARESAALLDPLLASEGRTIAFSAPQTTSAMMARGDRDAATQALVAVLDNARKYGRGQVDVAVTADAESMRVEVRDRGDGVDASERERIFERFVRGARHRHGSTPGAGIGLYLARAVLRQLGGDLAAVSPDDGIGARFVLTLPKSPHA